MQNITTIAHLQAAIAEAETAQTKAIHALKEEAIAAYESMQPLQVLKTTLKNAATLPNLKDNLINASMGLVAGYFSKEVLIGDSKNPIRKVLGAFLEFGVANVVSKNTATIKSFAENIWHQLMAKKEAQEENY